MGNASSAYNNSTTVLKKKATALKESADKIYQEVLTLDATLANSDKYYVKTREKKIEELSQRTETSIIDEADIFIALEKVKEQFKVIAVKYSKDKLPALIDGVSYVFSKQRKQDYEDLIILKNTLEILMREIKKVIPELIKDSMQTDKDSNDKKTFEINSKYQSEINALKTRYENNVEELADEICAQLDAILPDSLLCSIKEINEQYPNIFSKINYSYKNWYGTIIVGYIDYPLELYVTSNILFSLIKDKCKAILAQNKLLRFPLVFSLSNNFNLLVKYSKDVNLRNQFINSVIQSFISSVPVSSLTLSIIDAESHGLNITLIGYSLYAGITVLQ